MLVALWNQAKMILSYLVGLVVVTVDTGQGSDLGRYLVAYLEEECRRKYSIGSRSYTSLQFYVKPLERQAEVGFSNPNKVRKVYVYRGSPLLVTHSASSVGGSTELSFNHVRGTVDFEALVRAALARLVGLSSDEPEESRFRVVQHIGSQSYSEEPEDDDDPDPSTFQREGYFPIGWGWGDLGEPPPACPLDMMSLSG